MSNAKIKKMVSKYMAGIGKKGGSAHTEKQREAHKLALITISYNRHSPVARYHQPPAIGGFFTFTGLGISRHA